MANPTLTTEFTPIVQQPGVTTDFKPVSVQPSSYGVGGGFEKTSWGQALTEAGKNLPGSTAQQFKNAWQAASHPIETSKAIGRVGVGAVQTMVPGKQDYEKYWWDLENALMDRYGSVEDFKQTLASDPAGLLVDLASFTFPAAKAGQMPRLAKAASLLDPISGSLSMARKTAGMITPKWAPSLFFESAIKMSKTIPQKERAQIVNRALALQLMPTNRSLRKLQGLMDGVSGKIQLAVEQATGTGVKIPLDDLFKSFSEMKRELLKNSSEPLKGGRIFASVEKEIREANKRLGRGELTPLEAQNMKKKIYTEVEKEYQRIGHSPVRAGARMAVAKNLRTAIEKIVPEVKYLNPNYGVMKGLYKVLNDSAQSIRKRDFLAIGTAAKAYGGGAAFGPIGAVAGLMLGLLDSQPLIKAKLGLVMAKLREKGIVVRPALLGTRLGLYQAGKVEQEPQPHTARVPGPPPYANVDLPNKQAFPAPPASPPQAPYKPSYPLVNMSSSQGDVIMQEQGGPFKFAPRGPQIKP